MRFLRTKHGGGRGGHDPLPGNGVEDDGHVHAREADGAKVLPESVVECPGCGWRGEKTRLLQKGVRRGRGTVVIVRVCPNCLLEVPKVRGGEIQC